MTKKLLLGFLLVGVLVSLTGWRSTDIFDKDTVVDCGDESYEKAEAYYYKKVRYLTIDIDQWARIPNRFEVKLNKAVKDRQVYYNRWLDVRCRCRTDKLTRFEKSVCFASGYLGSFKPAEKCLIHK